MLWSKVEKKPPQTIKTDGRGAAPLAVTLTHAHLEPHQTVPREARVARRLALWRHGRVGHLAVRRAGQQSTIYNIRGLRKRGF